jgi:hypothetical protein
MTADTNIGATHQTTLLFPISNAKDTFFLNNAVPISNTIINLFVRTHSGICTKRDPQKVAFGKSIRFYFPDSLKFLNNGWFIIQIYTV